jgi:hypothetical protein
MEALQGITVWQKPQGYFRQFIVLAYNQGTSLVSR